MPPARILADELVVRGVHEDRHGDAIAILVQREADHLAHAQAVEEQRRTHVDGAEAVRMQGIQLALLVTGHGGRVFHADEVLFFGFRLARVDADVGTRQQGAQPRHAAGTDLRAHHPEARIGGGEAPRFLAHVDRHQHLAQVLAEGNGTHLADVDVLVLDLGLARLQPFGALEADRYRGALVEDGLGGQAGADQRGQQRNEPYQRRQPAAALFHIGFRQRGDALATRFGKVACFFVRHAVLQSLYCFRYLPPPRVLPLPAPARRRGPRSGAGRTASPPAWSAPPRRQRPARRVRP